MDSRTQERVEEWESRPFGGGFDGLSDLAAADFSGAVSAAGSWLFMLNGRIVGVFDGDIVDFETASGTQYEAPHPSLPLLCTMEERGGETRANYYTNETPLQEVDETLQSGSFTGYIELSENVLSGDYYAVYYGGRRMAAAYIGNAERLLTGEEAFDRAADEVGIYEVLDVDIDVTDVPRTAGGGTDSEDAADRDSSRELERASESGTDTTESGIEVGIPSGDDADSDPTADQGSSSIEPINLSGTDPSDDDGSAGPDPIEDVTVDDSSSLTSDIDIADDPSGITASEAAKPDQERSATGITEAEPDADLDPTSSDDADGSRPPNGDDRTENTGEDSIRSSTVETAAEGGVDEPTEVDVETQAETETETETETDGPTDPDLAEVEAAAKELDRNISWVEEDTEADGTVPDTDDSSLTVDDATRTDGDDLEEQFEREEEWRETRRIPSIDPDDSETNAVTASSTGSRNASAGRSSTVSDAGASEGGSSPNEQSDSRGSPRTMESTAGGASSGGRESTSRTQPSQQGGSGTRSTQSSDQEGQNRVSALSEKLETLQEQRDAVVTEAEEVKADRNQLQSQNEDLSVAVEQLQSRIQELETELKRAREGGTGATGASPTTGTTLSPDQALSGTNIFVRYVSKSQPTLETAHDGAADRVEVTSNLRLEHHTQFDSADAVVDGEPYEDFLTSSMEYRFVNWLTELVLYEIRDTGNANGLADLYDAIPRIDRAELGSTISLADDETEDVPDQVTFDIVAYDKMGNPLVLATLNDSREPASKKLLEQLEEASSAVKANYPSLAASVAVTSSYFEPGALEVAEQATSSGFLSRGSKLSYVNLSRKEGYHLCLVESRSEGFHMTVPEL
ncbi:DUF7527 domain-containing protein [Natrinema caseinilyticum]|uniref:DUF7527 domain-containing protein n=1 Tax=Natrinema caseinilyticum TaxID=2961570 RepID=UPI0020C43400|nr:transcriptional regulator [Natrinema caseinilyticum]